MYGRFATSRFAVSVLYNEVDSLQSCKVVSLS